MKPKLIRTSTVAISLDLLLKGQLAFLSENYNVIAVSGKDSHLETVANRERVPTINVSMSRKISPIKDLISLINLYFLFKKEKPLIVHSITPKAGLLTMVAAYFARVPIRVHTFTGLVFPTKSGAMKQLLVIMDKILCKCATNVYPEGEGVKRDLIQHRITTKPLKVIANGNINGIDLEYFNPENVTEIELIKLRASLGIQRTDFVYIFIGRLVADKGINELIAAFVKLNKKNNNIKLLLVGHLEQELNPISKATLFDIQHNSNIISTGYQDVVRDYLALADTFVLPSYREGFPNVLLQAGAMGLPSIVTNINGCNEIIINNYNGIIIPVKNEITIFDAMQLLLKDELVYHTLQSNARKGIENRFDQQVVWKAILEEYKIITNNVSK
ncbi:glycosyltransferase [Flavobacterium sp.]|uniref:glycosyltransferase n=1 Tax=Flavobacterium sp. TaxID=239 RepID=UPI003BEAD12F